jgi:hypothetical protein
MGSATPAAKQADTTKSAVNQMRSFITEIVSRSASIK